MELNDGGQMRSPGSYSNRASSALHIRVFWSECGLFGRDLDESTAQVFNGVKAGGPHPHVHGGL